MFVVKENSRLGPTSALEEKGKKIDVGEKKNRRASEPRGCLGRGKASALPKAPLGSFRSPIFFPFDPAFPLFFFSTAEPSPRLENSSTCTQGWK